MDYSAVTSSEVEFRAAICLCGSRYCRGSFLHYSSQDDLQLVLNRYCSPLYRFASLASACSDVPINEEAEILFARHGIGKYALGTNCPEWIRKYAVEMLRFIEYERRSLPSALLRKNLSKASPLPWYNCTEADSDARGVMESRIQAVAMSFSVVKHLISRQPAHLKFRRPVRRLPTAEAIAIAWANIADIPDLLLSHMCRSAAKKRPRAAIEAAESGAATSAGTELVEQETAAAAGSGSAASRVMDAARDIRVILQGAPGTMGELSRGILCVRNALIPLIDLSTPTAR